MRKTLKFAAKATWKTFKWSVILIVAFVAFSIHGALSQETVLHGDNYSPLDMPDFSKPSCVHTCGDYDPSVRGYGGGHAGRGAE